MTSLTVFNENGLELVINLQTGEAFATQAGYARMSGISKTALANRLARGYNRIELPYAEMITAGGLQKIKLISSDMFFQWLLKDNPEIINKLTEVYLRLNLKIPKLRLKNTNEKKSYNFLEKKLQIKLKKLYNGKVEVSCETGKIDLLTDKYVIEIKYINRWKHAIGQVLVYALEFPDRKAMLVLYGSCSNAYRLMIESYCSKLSVDVLFAEDIL